MNNVKNKIIFGLTAGVLILFAIWVTFYFVDFSSAENAEAVGFNFGSALIAIVVIYVVYRMIKSAYKRLILPKKI